MTWRWRRFPLVFIVCAAGCAGLFRAGPTPPALVGAWVDVERTTPDDSLIWLLAPSGNERWLRVRVRRDASGRVEQDTSRRQHGMWYLSDEQLCFDSRPGRFGPSCLRFKLDTLPSGRRLTLLGDHERVLLEHR